MGKSNVPKAIGHARDDNQSRKDRAIKEHKAERKLAAVHRQMHIREDTHHLSEHEQNMLEQKLKREEKERRAKAMRSSLLSG